MASTKMLCFLLTGIVAAHVEPTYDKIPGVQGKVWETWGHLGSFRTEPKIDVLYQAPAGVSKGIVLILPGNNRASDMFAEDEIVNGRENCKNEDDNDFAVRQYEDCRGLPTARQMRESILERGYIAVSTSASTGRWGIGGSLADLDSARTAKAVQHVMNATGTHSHPVYVVGTNAGQFMPQMLKQTHTQMPNRHLKKAGLKVEALPSIHQNIKCFAPQLSALQDVEPIAKDARAKAILKQNNQRKLKIKGLADMAEDPLGDCLKRNGWGELQVDMMSNQVKRGFVSKKVAQARGVNMEELLELGDQGLGELCPQSNYEVSPVNGALAGPKLTSALEKTKKVEKIEKIDGLTLFECMVMTGWSQSKVAAMEKHVMRKFVTKKVSVEYEIPVKDLEKYSDDDLASMCPTAKAASTEFKLVTKLMNDRTYPPTIFVHMPKNSNDEVNIAKSMCQLEQKDVRTAEVQSYPKRVTVPALVNFGFSEANAQNIVKVWTEGGALNKNGFLESNPDGTDLAWTPQIADVARSLWAEDNMIAEHTGKILDFCEGKQIKDDDDESLKLKQRFLFNSQCKFTQASLNNLV